MMTLQISDLQFLLKHLEHQITKYLILMNFSFQILLFFLENRLILIQYSHHYLLFGNPVYIKSLLLHLIPFYVNEL